MTTTTSSTVAPAGATHTHRAATALGTVAVVLALALFFGAVEYKYVDSPSSWGYAGMLICLLSIPIAFWGMTSRMRHTTLNAACQPIERIWNAPGSTWTYFLGAQEIDQSQILKRYRDRYAQITVWRSIRLPLVLVAYGMLAVGATIITLAASANGLL